MSLIVELRNIISEAVNKREVASGIDIVAQFDWKWHALPTLNEFRQAIKNVPDLQISKDAQGVLQFSASTELPNPIGLIVEDDVHVICDAYMERMKRK